MEVKQSSKQRQFPLKKWVLTVSNSQTLVLWQVQVFAQFELLSNKLSVYSFVYFCFSLCSIECWQVRASWQVLCCSNQTLAMWNGGGDAKAVLTINKALNDSMWCTVMSIAYMEPNVLWLDVFYLEESAQTERESRETPNAELLNRK